MKWEPIETYDKLKRKPKMAVFWFKEAQAGRSVVLYATPYLSRTMGSRICTHWMRLPDPPEVEAPSIG